MAQRKDPTPDRAIAREVAKQNDEIAGSLVTRAQKMGLDLPGAGDAAAMMEYIMGKEPHGQFPLGWCPTDRAAVEGAQNGTGPGEIEDGKDNGKQGF